MSYFDLGLWFSPKGRINRRPYFFAGLVAGGLFKAQELLSGVYRTAYLPVLLVALYVTIALGIKRCHDRGRSGFFMVLYFIPILNLWPFVELTFLKGTTGPNEHGPDPLGSPGP